jgi:hypothetical protein
MCKSLILVHKDVDYSRDVTKMKEITKGKDEQAWKKWKESEKNENVFIKHLKMRKL